MEKSADEKVSCGREAGRGVEKNDEAISSKCKKRSFCRGWPPNQRTTAGGCCIESVE